MPATKSRPTVAMLLKNFDPCDQGKEWANKYTSRQKAWNECDRPDWMFWYLDVSGIGRHDPFADAFKPVTACLLDCAMLARKHWPSKHVKLIRKCVAVARNWTAGKESGSAPYSAWMELRAIDVYEDGISDENLYAVRAIRAAAGGSIDWGAATCAAEALCHHLWRPLTMTTEYSRAYQKVRVKCCDIIRKHFPKPPKIEN